ncbi:hypothetical protein GOP47_0018077 [Adiantum capillus-veneris]|uniref:BHLH domain-containing protein n=1 Tax=Adiantum capillus-veneris TaxID=13818 RepID=A0A9D4UGM7_ADICA|nr:hypothetical protein GOP47_0018077 [Adiantum capillus-veneris]
MATVAAAPASRDELDTHEQLLRDIAALEEVDSCSSLVLQELLQRKPSSPPSPPSFTTRAESKQIRPSALQLQQDFATNFMRSETSLDHLVMNSQGMTLPALTSGPTMPKKTHVSASRKAKFTSLRRAVEKSSKGSTEFSPPEQDKVGISTHGKTPEAPMCAQAKKEICGHHFLTERQRREYLNEKYQVLRSLIPNPTKADRASIVQDAIDYVNELKQLTDQLQCKRGLADQKRQKVVDSCLDRVVDVGNTQSCKGKHLSSTSKVGQEGTLCQLSHKTSRYGTEVDVRVFDDEATIKVIQHQPQRSLLLDAVSMLNEAELELLYANGARIGNCHAYMLNVKIQETKAMQANQIAKQLLDHIDASLQQTPSTTTTQVL